MEAPNFDEEFEEAVAEWRSRHRLAEDDAVLLLVELFRLHQRHWDPIRRRELPSFEQFRSDIAKLSEAAKAFQRDSTLSNVVVSGSGFTNRIANIPAGTEHRLMVQPSADSGVRLVFDADTQHIDSGNGTGTRAASRFCRGRSSSRVLPEVPHFGNVGDKRTSGGQPPSRPIRYGSRHHL